MAQSNRETSGLEALGAVVVLLVFVPVMVAGFAFARGFVLQNLWGWFITPVSGVESPGLVLCMGLTLVVGFLTHQPQARGAKTRIVGEVASGIVYLALILGTGWIIHFFV